MDVPVIFHSYSYTRNTYLWNKEMSFLSCCHFLSFQGLALHAQLARWRRICLHDINCQEDILQPLPTAI